MIRFNPHDASKALGHEEQDYPRVTLGQFDYVLIDYIPIFSSDLSKSLLDPDYPRSQESIICRPYPSPNLNDSRKYGMQNRLCLFDLLNKKNMSLLLDKLFEDDESEMINTIYKTTGFGLPWQLIREQFSINSGVDSFMHGTYKYITPKTGVISTFGPGAEDFKGISFLPALGPIIRKYCNCDGIYQYTSPSLPHKYLPAEFLIFNPKYVLYDYV